MANDPVLQALHRRVAERAAQAGLRRLRTVERAQGTYVVIDGRELLSFASNDYLGLAAHPAVRDALIECAARDGVGATAAHLLGGHRREHAALEVELAQFCQAPRALLFSSGYAANLGVLSALLDADGVCIQDKLNHASLIDAARLSGCTLKRYLHTDTHSAERKLDSVAAKAAVLATDGVFSMDGDSAPLPELARLTAARQVPLMVDDAHGFGVIGPDGRGSVAAAQLDAAAVPIYMATLGKALGVAGAFVAGSEELIEGLLQFSRTYVYTTALPPALAAATRAALQVSRCEAWRREKLARLIAHFRRATAVRGMAVLDSRTPIQALLIGDSARALRASAALERAGFYVPAIRAPTVPPGRARLRITLSALHSEREVELLVDALEAAIHAAPARRMRKAANVDAG